MRGTQRIIRYPRRHPLKIRGKGALSNGKKKKIDLGKLVDNNSESCRLYAAGPFEDLSSEI